MPRPSIAVGYRGWQMTAGTRRWTDMTPLGTFRLRPIRAAAGIQTDGDTGATAPAEDAEEMRRQIAAWNPIPLAAMGMTGFLVILWLMLVKPF